MARDKDEGPGFNPLGWMFTFSDLVTLLLTFFVMLLAMKAPEVTKLQAIFGIFKEGGSGSLNVSDQAKVSELKQLLDSLRQPTSKELSAREQKLAEKLGLPPSTETLLSGLIQPGVKLRQEQRGTVLTLTNDVLFPAGGADLSPKAQEVLHEAAQVLRYGTMPLSIEGYTDDLPPSPDSPYEDNWGLSLARAMAVLHYLTGVEKIPPGRLRVGALGDTRPLVPNDSPQHRAMNRRTEIVILSQQQ